MINSRDLRDLLPSVRAKAEQFIDLTKAKLGIDLLVTSTYRDAEAQNALYAQGRTTAGKIVTYAKAGQSLHNHRAAFDIVPIIHGKLFWSTRTKADLEVWESLGQLGEVCGLEWAGRWEGKAREYVHFQDSSALHTDQLGK